MADRLIIHDLIASCRLGVTERERAKAQKVWIDLELEADAKRASATDDVRHAIDYARVVASVRSLAQRVPYRLLETLAEAVGARVLAECKTPRVVVRVRKRALPMIGYAAVEVERRQRPQRLARGERRGR